MTLREMVEKQLKEGGFDGLCHPDMECGCLLEDLFPCENPDWDECRGGVKKLQDDGDWIIVLKE